VEAHRLSDAMRTAALTATCHCGALQVTVPRHPRTLTACNCSICRRYGALWAYYRADTVRLERAAGAAEDYLFGSRHRRFVRCATCGCVTHWERARRSPASHMAVNARLLEPEVIAGVRIRLLDGARTWKYLD
jgi:hypothetical protein